METFGYQTQKNYSFFCGLFSWLNYKSGLTIIIVYYKPKLEILKLKKIFLGKNGSIYKD